MKELNLNEVAQVSGGGNSGDRLDRGRTASTNSGSSGSPSRYSAPGVTACNCGIIGGMIAGSPAGIVGVGLGLVGGALAGGCFARSSGNDNGNRAGSAQCSSGAGGTCSR